VKPMAYGNRGGPVLKVIAGRPLDQDRGTIFRAALRARPDVTPGFFCPSVPVGTEQTPHPRQGTHLRSSRFSSGRR
jgi:hypothetical protein